MCVALRALPREPDGRACRRPQGPRVRWSSPGGSSKREALPATVSRLRPVACPRHDSHASRRETPMGRSGSWFSIIVDFGPEELPGTACSLSEVARETGRTYSAVKAALRAGRLPALDFQPGVRRARPARSYVAATPEQLQAWRVRSVEEVLRGRPDLPQDPRKWVRAPDAAHLLGVATSTIYRCIRRGHVRRLAWGASSPFREEVRYWLPDLAGSCGS